MTCSHLSYRSKMDTLIRDLCNVSSTEEQGKLLKSYADAHLSSPELAAHLVARHIIFELSDPSEGQKQVAVALLEYCFLSNVNAAIELAQCFLFGYGVERSPRTALDFYWYAQNILHYAAAEEELMEDIVTVLGNADDAPVIDSSRPAAAG